MTGTRALFRGRKGWREGGRGSNLMRKRRSEEGEMESMRQRGSFSSYPVLFSFFIAFESRFVYA